MWCRRVVLLGVLGMFTVGCGSQNPYTSPVAPTTTASTDVRLMSVRVSVPSSTLTVGEAMRAVATATYSDNSTVDITSLAVTTWTSSSTSLATVSPDGHIVGAHGACPGCDKGGPVTISAEYGGYTGSVELIIEADVSLWTLSGKVTDLGNVALSDVLIELINGDAEGLKHKGRSTRTNGNGEFEIAGLQGYVCFLVRGDGYDKRQDETLCASRNEPHVEISLVQSFGLYIVATRTTLRVGETTTVSAEIRFRDGRVEESLPSWHTWRDRHDIATVTWAGVVRGVSEGRVSVCATEKKYYHHLHSCVSFFVEP